MSHEADPRDVSDILLHDHRMIAAAIIAGKPIKARDQMRLHLERVAEFYDRLSGGEVLEQLIEWR